MPELLNWQGEVQCVFSGRWLWQLREHPLGLLSKSNCWLWTGELRKTGNMKGSLCQRDHPHLQFVWATFGQILKTILKNCPWNLCICARITSIQDLNSSIGKENISVLYALTICLASWHHALTFAYVISWLDQLIYSFPPLPLNNVSRLSLPHPWMTAREDSSTSCSYWWSHFYVFKSALQLVSRPSQSFPSPAWGRPTNSAKPHRGRVGGVGLGVRLGQKVCS